MEFSVVSQWRYGVGKRRKALQPQRGRQRRTDEMVGSKNGEIYLKDAEMRVRKSGHMDMVMIRCIISGMGDGQLECGLSSFYLHKTPIKAKHSTIFTVHQKLAPICSFRIIH